MKPITTRLAAAAIALTATFAVAGCTSNNDPDPALPTSTAPILTRIPVEQKSPDQVASDAALSKIRDFYAVQDELEADPAVPADKLATVAANPVFDGVTGGLMLRRSTGIVSSGQITIVSSVVTGVEAPVDAAGQPTAGAAWATAETCTDTSTWNSNYPDGTTAKDPDVRFVLNRLTVRNADWPDSNGWRVTSLQPENVPSCGANP